MSHNHLLSRADHRNLRGGWQRDVCIGCSRALCDEASLVPAGGSAIFFSEALRPRKRKQLIAWQLIVATTASVVILPCSWYAPLQLEQSLG